MKRPTDARSGHEAHISAAQQEKENDARIQESNEHQEWTLGFEKEESERKKTPCSLIIRDGCPMASRSLKNSSQFRLVYSRGRKEAGTKVVIYYLTRENDGLAAGFVASKRIGKACQRNRAKRLMREAFRRVEQQLKVANLWIVFIASFRPKESTFHEILEDVEGSLGRAGLLISNG
jgi:ribonuclease P protein component